MAACGGLMIGVKASTSLEASEVTVNVPSPTSTRVSWPASARRVSSVAKPEAIALVVDRLSSAKDDAQRLAILRGMRDGLKGRRDLAMPNNWAGISAALADSGNSGDGTHEQEFASEAEAAATAAAAAGTSTPPENFGRYRVRKLLGKGAMGTVYLAEDTCLGRLVAPGRRFVPGVHVGLPDPPAASELGEVDAELARQALRRRRCPHPGGRRGRRHVGGVQDPAHDGPHLDHLARGHDPLQDPASRCLDREADLVGLELVQRLPRADLRTVGLQPGHQPALGHDVAEQGKAEVRPHQSRRVATAAATTVSTFGGKAASSAPL